ncbi:DeoR/GlpR family DNA-binding transcription regulator [Alkalicoccus chagannorensis]|uniref:DeoR/GlpR family DNA-binding transcription regulator n=1 Tax=Alkalicoccus chagannorensis TaxID=427072 RepID=UPI0004067529|nr:DeoR/GlpR family DNA-binding transcription regulator [Alkalicoccus chagannorensis]
MYQEERRGAILSELQDRGRIAADDICTLFDVSRDTARRDLVQLEKEGQIIRTRGGALLPAAMEPVRSYAGRLQLVSQEKKRIGVRAAADILPGARLLLDASTTVQALAEALTSKPCSILTNSINQVDVLAANRAIDIELIGGTFHPEHRFLYGAAAVERLRSFYADQAYLGMVGISEHGLTLREEAEGRVKQAMMEQASEVILLADHTKFGHTDYYRCGGLEDIDVLITDRYPGRQMAGLLDDCGVTLIITEEESP